MGGADAGAAALKKEGGGWDGVPRNSPRATPERAVDGEGCHRHRQVSTRSGPCIHLSTPQICMPQVPEIHSQALEWRLEGGEQLSKLTNRAV